MLRLRLISAAIIIALLLALLWLDFRLVLFGVPGAWLLPLVILISILATEELLSMLQAKDVQPLAWPVYLGSVMLPLAAAAPVVFQHVLPKRLDFASAGWPMFVLAAAAAAIFVSEMRRYQQQGMSLLRVALGVFALVYIGQLLSFWILLRLMRDNGWGMAALFSLWLIVKMSDTGAFAFGKRFGRRKLTPMLSPGKTWEGAIGGIATACITSWAFFHFAAPIIVADYQEPTVAAELVYGALLALTGIVGDLAESLLKRDMERKDSSTWLPGLGGVLDIIDSVLLAGPVAWLCWELGLMG